MGEKGAFHVFFYHLGFVMDVVDHSSSRDTQRDGAEADFTRGEGFWDSNFCGFPLLTPPHFHSES